MMKLGLGLYRAMLTADNFRFARQVGATHIVAHLTASFSASDRLAAVGGRDHWGVTTNQGNVWTADELIALRRAINDEGLELAALENLDPAFWHDILLDGPLRDKQIAGLKRLLRNMGQAGIPVLGYYFSLAGPWGRVRTSAARGGAESIGFHRSQLEDSPIPLGMVWNMIYDPDAPQGVLASISEEELWQRLSHFLGELVPVAEEAGVTLAAHPDDPPLPVLRGQPRLLYERQTLQRLLELVPSPRNALELCVGTLAEMSGEELDIYETVDRYSAQKRIGYVHLRNVAGSVPNYDEMFIDDGDVDMLRILRILHANEFEGVIIPDHTPQMLCDAPWHAGMAHALGWMRGALMSLAS